MAPLDHVPTCWTLYQQATDELPPGAPVPGMKPQKISKVILVNTQKPIGAKPL